MIRRTLLLAASAAVLGATPALAQTAPADPAAAQQTSAAPPASAAPAADTAAPSPAPAAPASAPAAAPAAPAAPAQIAAAADGTVPPPPAGKGQIVFFRPSAFIGMAVWFRVRENDVELGKLSNGAYFVQVLDPGKHTFTAATENKDRLTLEIDDGETLYVKGGVSAGFVIAEANIAPSDAATFKSALARMHLAAPPAAKPASTIAQGGK